MADLLVAEIVDRRGTTDRRGLGFVDDNRDIESVGADGGMIIATAGSINPGSRRSGRRAIVSTIQEHGRYRAYCAGA